MSFQVLKVSVDKAYEILDSLPSMHMMALHAKDSKAHGAIVDALMQLQIARQNMPTTLTAPQITNCGYSSVEVCPHWQHSESGKAFAAELPPQSRR